MRRSVVVVLVILLALAGLAIYVVKKPEAVLKLLVPQLKSVGGISTRFVGDTAHTDLLLEIKNGKYFAVQLDSVVYRVHLDTALVLSGAQSFKTHVQRGQYDTLYLHIPFPYKRVSQKIRSSQHRDSLPLQVSLRLVYNTVFGKASLPFKKSMAIEVPVPPRIDVEKIEYLGRKGRRVHLNAVLHFHNNGKLQVRVHDLRYEAQAGDALTAKGRHPQAITVAPKKSLRLSLPIEVELKNPAKTLWKVAVNRDQLNYNIKIRAQLSEGDPPTQAIPVLIEKNGTFELKK